jgi:hypothetical protein
MSEVAREEAASEVCYGKKCTANEHCCPGHACVDVDGGKTTPTVKIKPAVSESLIDVLTLSLILSFGDVFADVRCEAG